MRSDATTNIAPPKPWPVPLSDGSSLVVHAHSGEIGDRLKLQYHPEYELTLLRAASGRRLVGDRIDQFTGGDLALVGPDTPHGWAVETVDAVDGPRFVVLLFSRESLGLPVLAKPELAAVDRLLREGERGLVFPRAVAEQVTERIMGMTRANPCGRFLACLEVLDFLATRSGYLPATGPDYRPGRDERELERYARVLSFVQDEGHRRLSLAQAARVAGMSESAFTRFFRRHAGTSFINFLNRWRIERACILLRQTRRKVLDIAMTVGFGNLSHFNRQFQKLIGTTPRDYRRGAERGS